METLFDDREPYRLEIYYGSIVHDSEDLQFAGFGIFLVNRLPETYYVSEQMDPDDESNSIERVQMKALNTVLGIVLELSKIGKKTHGYDQEEDRWPGYFPLDVAIYSVDPCFHPTPNTHLNVNADLWQNIQYRLSLLRGTRVNLNFVYLYPEDARLEEPHRLVMERYFSDDVEDEEELGSVLFCGACGLLFDQYEDLDAHIKSDHLNRLVSDESMIAALVTGFNTNEYWCIKCPRFFITRNAFLNHMDRAHPDVLFGRRRREVEARRRNQRRQRVGVE